MSTKQRVKKPARKSPKQAAKKALKQALKNTVKKTVKAAPKKSVKKSVNNPRAASAPKRAAARATPLTSAADFMAHAYAMEAEAAERYAEFADSMEMHNNREVAELFRKLARIEQRHADQILEQMGWKQLPVTSANVRWQGMEGPETADPTELHYLMQPYHALQIALHNEKRARDFFANLAKVTKDAGVRKGALEMEEDEAGHVRLIEEWLERTPKPDANWQADPDPPVLSD